MKGAKGVLINITGGMDMTLFEVDEAANRIREEVDTDANIIFGSTFDEKMNGIMRVSVVATGIASEAAQQPKPTVIPLVPTGQTAIRPQAPAVPPVQTQFAATATAATAVGVAQPALRTTASAHPVLRPATVETVAPAQRVASALTAPVATTMTAPAQRPEPLELNLRQEPSFSAPEPVHEHQHDMSTLSRAVTDIAQSAKPQQQHQPQPQTHEEPRRTGSLLDRLISSRRPQRAPEPARAPEQTRTAQAEAPRFGGMEARREPTVTSQSDDLDIPAFLRRSAN